MVGVGAQLVQVQLWVLVAIAYFSIFIKCLDMVVVLAGMDIVLGVGCGVTAGAVFRRLRGGELSQSGSIMTVLVEFAAGVTALVKSELKRGGTGVAVLSSTFACVWSKWNSLSIGTWSLKRLRFREPLLILCATGPWLVRPLKPNQGLHWFMLLVLSVLVLVIVVLFFFFFGFLSRKPFLTLIQPSVIFALFVSLFKLSLLPLVPILE